MVMDVEFFFLGWEAMQITNTNSAPVSCSTFPAFTDPLKFDFLCIGIRGRSGNRISGENGPNIEEKNCEKTGKIMAKNDENPEKKYKNSKQKWGKY